MRIQLRNNLISPSIKRLQGNLKQVPQKATDYWISKTPIDTGNARSKTYLSGNNFISARYPYAERLDKGWSKQAPQGMSKPTKKYIQQLVRSIMKK